MARQPDESTDWGNAEGRHAGDRDRRERGPRPDPHPGLDPIRDADEVRALVREAVADYDDRSLAGGVPRLGDSRPGDPERSSMRSRDSALQQYFDDPKVEEIWVNQPVVGSSPPARGCRS